MRGQGLLLCVAVALFAAGPAAAQAPGAPADPGVPGYLDPERSEEAERKAVESMGLMLDAMRLFLESIPQYEPPEITSEGDIIIRRKPIPPLTPAEPDTRLAPDEDST